MCEPATMAAIGTAVAGAASTAVATAPTWLPIATAGLSMAAGAQDAARAAEAADKAGLAEGQAAVERAARLRAQGMKTLATQRIQQLNSGVEGGTGSALEIGGADAAELQLDALTEIYGGRTRKIALQKQAKDSRQQSRIMAAGAVGAAGVLAAGSLWGAFGAGAGSGGATATGSGAVGAPGLKGPW